MRTSSLIGFHVGAARNGYTAGRLNRIETDLAALPGARGVTACMVPLLSGSDWETDIAIEGAARPNPTAPFARFARP